jgi:hypothetical protein
MLVSNYPKPPEKPVASPPAAPAPAAGVTLSLLLPDLLRDTPPGPLKGRVSLGAGGIYHFQSGALRVALPGIGAEDAAALRTSDMHVIGKVPGGETRVVLVPSAEPAARPGSETGAERSEAPMPGAGHRGAIPEPRRPDLRLPDASIYSYLADDTGLPEDPPLPAAPLRPNVAPDGASAPGPRKEDRPFPAGAEMRQPPPSDREADLDSRPASGVRQDAERAPLDREELRQIARSLLSMAGLAEPAEESDTSFPSAIDARPASQDQPFSLPRGWLVACEAFGTGACQRIAIAFEEEPDERARAEAHGEGTAQPVRFIIDLQLRRLGELRLAGEACGRRLTLSVSGVPEALRPGLLAVWSLALDGLDLAGGLAFADADPSRPALDGPAPDGFGYDHPDLGLLDGELA